MVCMPETKRIKNLRNDIIKKIPKIPNNKETLQVLEAKPLTDLFIIYANWAIRFIQPRIRNIKISPEAKNDKKWKSLSNKISTFLEKVKNGEDLTPNLSKRVHEKGFSLAASKSQPNDKSWEDKDFLLNVMGYYHFHLGVKKNNRGLAERTDDVLFAKVTRNEFEVIGIFDHTVFDTSIEPSNQITVERKRLYETFDNGSLHSILSSITMSGHATRTIFPMIDYVNVIKEIDPKLDDSAYIERLFNESNLSIPKRTNLIWTFRYLDLGVLDKRSNAYFVFRYGPN